MIRPRESITQLGFLVRPGGFEEAVTHWLEVVGAGPFFTGSFRLENQRFRGRPSDISCTVALGYHGDMQVELIHADRDGPGPYQEWHKLHPNIPRAGIYHHMMFAHDDYDATKARYLAGGCREGFEAKASGGKRMAYLEAFDTIGGYVELVERNPAWDAMCVEMRAISKDWDGRDPVRGLGSLSVKLGP